MPQLEAPIVDALAEEAEIAAERGAWPEATAMLVRLLGEVDTETMRYEGWARSLADVALRAGRAEIAAPTLEYLLEHRRADEAWRQAGDLEAAARARLRAGDPAGAAEDWERAGAFARAGAAWEDASNPARAARAWDRAAQAFEGRGDGYRAALALLNLGLARRDAKDGGAQTALSRAMVLLEEEADRAESAGELQRALSCYHALVHLGRRTGSHENLAEGFLNCVRLAQGRGHRFFALQYFHDFAEASREAGEHQAEAEVLREAADWCRRSGLLYTNDFLGRSADAFEAVARAHLEAGAPVELAENALLSAVDCHNRRGDERRVQGVYRILAGLPLSDGRVGRYRRLAAREVPERDLEGGWRFRGYFSEAQAYPSTWRDDVVGEEATPSLLAPLPETVGDARLWDVVRRRALVVVLGHSAEDARPVELAAELGALGAPAALPPLGRLLERPEVPVRTAAARALHRLRFRESVGLAGRALDDPAEEVRDAALAALRHFGFPGAFAPLIRLYRDHTGLEARRLVVLALGRIVGLEHARSHDALDFLLHTLREGAPPGLEGELRTAIGANVDEATLPTLERHLRAEADPELRRFLERVATRVETERATRLM